MPERLAGIDRAELAGVAHQHEAGDVEMACNAQQGAHLRRRHHGCLVQHHDRSGKERAQLLKVRTGVFAIGRPATREEPLQRARMDPRFALQHARRGSRRSKADDPPLSGEFADLAQHGGLAGPGAALHADDPLLRQENGPHRVALSLGEIRCRQPCRDIGVAGQRPGMAEAGLHHGDHRAFRLQGPVGDEGAVGAPQRGVDQVAILHQLSDRLPDPVERMAPRRMRQRQCLELVRRKHRLPLLEAFRRAGDDLQGRQVLRLPHRPAGTGCREVGAEAKLLSPLRPDRLQHRPQRFVLAPPRRQRRHLRRGLAVVPAPLGQVGQDLSPARRERAPQLPAVTRDLEARDPSRHGGLDVVAPFHQPARQLVAVVGADLPGMAVEQGGLDAAPAPLRIARHVGDHGVGVELGIEIAARDMAEGCRDHVGRLDPRPLSRGGVPAAGLQEVPLDPVQRRPHRLVVGMHHAAVAMGITSRR